MARTFEVSWRLQDAHYLPFHKLLLGRNASVDELQRWLKRRGYRIERASIEAYAERVRGHAALVLGAVNGESLAMEKFIGAAVHARDMQAAGWFLQYAKFLIEAAAPAKGGR